MLDKILGFGSVTPSSPQQALFSPIRASSGIHMSEEVALTFSAVWAAVKYISETIAMLPWRLHVQEGSGTRVKSESNLDVILNKCVNEEMCAFQFLEFLTASALLHGNGYAEIEFTRGGEVRALWSLHPDRVTPSRDQNNKLVYKVRDTTGKEVSLPMRQMFHLRGPTKDGIVGRSVISLARESWGLGIAAEQFAGGFFGNGAIPSLVVLQSETAPTLSKEGTENLLESFERRHKGAKGAGKPAFLEPGYSIETIGIPQKDAQFLETRQHSITDVARWFRVPPHKIGDMSRATFSNIESQELSAVNDAIMPWCVRLEQEAFVKFLLANNMFTKIDLTGLLRGNSIDRANYYSQMRNLGAMSANEIREAEDMNPVTGGDKYWVPANMLPVGDNTND